MGAQSAVIFNSEHLVVSGIVGLIMVIIGIKLRGGKCSSNTREAF